jgi:hypothetical protein
MSGQYAALLNVVVGSNSMNVSAEIYNSGPVAGYCYMPGLCDVYLQVGSVTGVLFYVLNGAGGSVFPRLTDTASDGVTDAGGTKICRRQIILPPFPVLLDFQCYTNPGQISLLITQ